MSIEDGCPHFHVVRNIGAYFGAYLYRSTHAKRSGEYCFKLRREWLKYSDSSGCPSCYFTVVLFASFCFSIFFFFHHVCVKLRQVVFMLSLEIYCGYISLYHMRLGAAAKKCDHIFLVILNTEHPFHMMRSYSKEMWSHSRLIWSNPRPVAMVPDLVMVQMDMVILQMDMVVVANVRYIPVIFN